MNRLSHLTLAFTGLLVAAAGRSPAADGQLELSIVDSATHEPLPVRVEFTTAAGRTARLRGVGEAALGQHFYLPGKATLPLRRGGYRFLLDAGPEYRTQRGHFEIERHADDAKEVQIERFANLSDEGWWAGDLEAQRPAGDLPIIAAAEGLHYAPTTAWQWDGRDWKPTDTSVRKPPREGEPYFGGRALGAYAAVIESPGGRLLLFSESPLSRQPLNIKDESSAQIISKARDAGLHVVAASPTAWELPVWVATGKLSAVSLITRQSEWRGVVDKDPHGRARDKSFYPGRQGLARWGQTIYFHLLNAGVRLAPAAGSGSGVNDSPLGVNRAYVHLEGPFLATAWWAGLERGASVVTNGPLLRPKVGGDPPGVTYRIEADETIDFQIALNLASREPVEYLEILKDGAVAAEVRLSDWAASRGKLPPVTFDASGWFAVRAATVSTDKYQFALTAPYYVESPAGPRISRASVEFFLTWLEELAERRDKFLSLSDEDLALAREFWNYRLESANAP